MLLCLILSGCGPGVPSGPSPTWTPDADPTPTETSRVAFTPSPVGSTPTAQPEVAFPPGLRDADSGVFYVESDGAILRVDLKARRVQRTFTPRLERFRNFVATRHLLVVKQIWDGVGFVVTKDGDVRELPNELGGTGRLYAGGRDAIWVVPEEPSGAQRTILLFSTATGEPKLLERRNVPATLGIPGPDGAGNLLADEPSLPYVVTRSSTKRLPGWRRGGEMLGIGATSILVKPCPRCAVTQHNRRASDKKRRATARGLKGVDKLLATYDYGADGELSPSGRYMAMSVTMNNEARDFRLAVTDLTTGKTLLMPGTTTQFNANDQSVWLSKSSDRWLLAVTDQTLRILDTTTGTVHTWGGVTAGRVAVVG
ncbi:MAG: hypothetical protein KBG85_08580 [Micropruina sp.]|nr:hypothetical protein [Micropruina sp.]